MLFNISVNVFSSINYISEWRCNSSDTHRFLRYLVSDVVCLMEEMNSWDIPQGSKTPSQEEESESERGRGREMERERYGENRNKHSRIQSCKQHLWISTLSGVEGIGGNTYWAEIYCIRALGLTVKMWLNRQLLYYQVCLITLALH